MLTSHSKKCFVIHCLPKMGFYFIFNPYFHLSWICSPKNKNLYRYAFLKSHNTYVTQFFPQFRSIVLYYWATTSYYCILCWGKFQHKFIRNWDVEKFQNFEGIIIEGCKKRRRIKNYNSNPKNNVNIYKFFVLNFVTNLALPTRLHGLG